MLATSKYLLNRNYDGINDIDAIKEDFASVKIKISYDNGFVNGTRRLIFSTVKGMRSQKFDKISHECNGLILEADTWRPLVVPFPTPRTNCNNNIMTSRIKNQKYSIYQLQNGTVINMYYWNGWHISTARGITMANVKTGKMTYVEMLDDILSQYGHRFESFTELLDQSTSYTFVIEHPNVNVQLGGVDCKSITFIQRAIIGEDVSIDRTEHGIDLEIPYQKKVDIDSIRTAYKELANSLNNYVSNSVALYGYIMFMNDNVVDDHQCVLLESSLMRFIRQTCYKLGEVGQDRDRTLATYAYLSPNRDMFTKLFPQYNQYIEQLDHIQNELCAHIEKSHDDVDHVNVVETKVTPSAVKYLIGEIKNTITLNKKTFYHIRPFINDIKYASIYMDKLSV